MVLTGDPEAARRSDTLRAASLVTKPFSPDLFLDVVRASMPSPVGSRGEQSGTPPSGRESPARSWAAPDHVVQLFDTPESRADTMCAFLYEGYTRGDNLLICAKPEHWHITSKGLEVRGCSVDHAIAHGRVTILDAEATVSKVLRHGTPDPDLFADTVGRLVHRLAQTSGAGVRIHGEMTDVLAEQDNFAGAQRVEELWNALRRQCSFALFCGYTAAHFAASRAGDALRSICRAHARVESSPPDSLASWLLQGHPSR